MKAVSKRLTLLSVYCLLSIIRATSALMMETASTSETSINFFQSIRRNNPEDNHLQGNIFEKDRTSVAVPAQYVSPCSSPRDQTTQVIWSHHCIVQGFFTLVGYV
jgi:hypothetical protein